MNRSASKTQVGQIFVKVRKRQFDKESHKLQRFDIYGFPKTKKDSDVYSLFTSASKNPAEDQD